MRLKIREENVKLLRIQTITNNEPRFECLSNSICILPMYLGRILVTGGKG